MAVKVEITKNFYDGSNSKLSTVDEAFDIAFKNMQDLGEILTFEVTDVDETTRTETLIFKDLDAIKKLKVSLLKIIVI